MILPEGIGKPIDKSKFNLNVFSKTPKMTVIQRQGYSLFVYKDKAFLSYKEEDGQETFIEFNKEDLTQLFFFKIDVMCGLIGDIPKKQDDFFKRQAFIELITEVSELGTWFLEVNNYWKKEG